MCEVKKKSRLYYTCQSCQKQNIDILEEVHEIRRHLSKNEYQAALTTADENLTLNQGKYTLLITILMTFVSQIFFRRFQLCRWVFLIWGVKYGSERQKFLKEREIGIKEQERRMKEERDAKLCEERRIQSEKDIEDLAKLAEPPKTSQPDVCHRYDMVNRQDTD